MLNEEMSESLFSSGIKIKKRINLNIVKENESIYYTSDRGKMR